MKNVSKIEPGVLALSHRVDNPSVDLRKRGWQFQPFFASGTEFVVQRHLDIDGALLIRPLSWHQKLLMAGEWILLNPKRRDAQFYELARRLRGKLVRTPDSVRSILADCPNTAQATIFNLVKAGKITLDDVKEAANA